MKSLGTEGSQSTPALSMVSPVLSSPPKRDLWPTEFGIVTLNCWGLRYISRSRASRFKAIADALLKVPRLSLVVLQEVWVQKDYDLLVSRLGYHFPYSRYFRSGFLGSGLCIFSACPIVNAMLLPFQLKGNFMKVWHGDWFTGKGVAVCQVEMRGLSINILNTHTLIDPANGSEYLAQRITQFLLLASIVNALASSGDLTILSGDLNADPTSLPMRLLFSLTKLVDSYTAAKKRYTHPSLLSLPNNFTYTDHGGTCGLITNTFTSAASRRRQPSGLRLDYVLFQQGERKRQQSSDGCYCKAHEYSRPFPSRALSCCGDLSYSDHEAVHVTFRTGAVSSSNRTSAFSDSCDSSQPSRAHVTKHNVKDEALRILARECKILRLKRIATLTCSGVLVLILAASIYFPQHLRASLPVSLVANFLRIAFSILVVILGVIQPIAIQHEWNVILDSMSILGDATSS